MITVFSIISIIQGVRAACTPQIPVMAKENGQVRRSQVLELQSTDERWWMMIHTQTEWLSPKDDLLTKFFNRWPALQVAPAGGMLGAQAVMKPEGEIFFVYYYIDWSSHHQIKVLHFYHVLWLLLYPASGCQKSCRWGLTLICFKMHFLLHAWHIFGCPFVMQRSSLA